MILELENGTYSYEEGQPALHHVGVGIQKGEKIAVVGSNGAGKSTFFLALNGVVQLQEGAVYFHGEQVEYKRQSLTKLRKGVGIVFQDPDHQIIGSTVEAEISFGLFNLGFVRDRAERGVKKVMEKTGLTALAVRPPHLLSGGEKKRVTIADVLVMEPEVILFDEPAASLDGRHVSLFKDQLEVLHKERITLVISTHDMNFVWEWADRVLVFCGGCLLADDVPERIFENGELLRQASLAEPLLYGLPGHPRTVREFLDHHPQLQD